MIFSVPNLITFGRLVLIPVLGVLLYFLAGKSAAMQSEINLWAFWIFVIAGVSDIVDGYYARKYSQVSRLGKFFDPLADKLVHLTVLVMLVPLGRIEAWLVVILLSREIFINGLRTIAIAEGVVMDAIFLAKKKTAWINVGLGGMILYDPVFVGTVLEFDAYAVGRVCIWIGLVFSVVSGAQYSVNFLKLIQKKEA